MHQQVIRTVVADTHILRHARGGRNGRNARIADQRVDLVALLQEEVHQLDEQHAAHRGDEERACAQHEDSQRLGSQEDRRLRRSSHRDADQDRHDVDQLVAGRGGQTLHHARLLQKVAQEEHTQQRNRIGHDKRRQQEADDREENLLGGGDGTRRTHLDKAFARRGQQTHHGRLDHRYEGHVRIGADSDGAHVLRSQTARQEDGRRTVGAADDGDRTGLVGRESERQSAHVGREDTDLRRSADKHQLGVRNQRREVGHGAHAEEDQRRIDAVTDAEIEVVEHRAFLVDADSVAGHHRDIADDDTETDRHQQHGLELVFDGKIEEEAPHGDHDEVLVAALLQEELRKSRLVHELGYAFAEERR